MSRLLGAALALAGALVGMAFCCWCALTSPVLPADTAECSSSVMLDDSIRTVPLYTQTDERWGSLPYAGADLATSGCGLTCAAMTWEYLSGEECTPAMLLNLVGNDYVQDGQNYMPGFCEWMSRQDSTLNYTVLYEDCSRALKESTSGRLVFGTMSGALHDGGREYGGHVVLIIENIYGNITVHDPCEAYPVELTYDEFNAVAWDYFISIGRSEDGA